MRNFGTLYRYELKKLFKRKLSWVAVIALSFFCVYGVIKAGTYPSGGEYPICDENGDETGEYIYISGEEIYTTYLKSAGKLDGRAIDDTLFQEMLENVPDLKASDFVIYFFKNDATYGRLYSMVGGLLKDPRSVTAEKFYAEQWEQTQLTCDHYGADQEGISEGEKGYWMEQAAKIEKPFIYQEPWRGTSALILFFNTLTGFLPIVAAVSVCTVFTEDRRTRMETLTFSTKESRFSLYLAKVLAGVTIAALVGVVITGVTIVAHLAVWGANGFDACIQMYMIASPRAITVGQMLLIMSVLLVIYTMLCGGMTMLIATIVRSSIAAIAVPVLLVQVLNYFRTGEYGWQSYLPRNLISTIPGVRSVELVNIFGVYLNNFQFGPLLYMAITVLLLALCWLGWRWSAREVA